TIDSKGRIQSWNRGAADLFGYSSEEILEQHITTIMPNRYLEKFYRELESFLAMGMNTIVGKTMELDCVSKDQTVFPSEVSIGSWEVNGKYYFCGIIRDISNRREVEKAMHNYNRQLETQNRELEQFAYIASHDLQEPLRTVTNYTQLLQSKYSDQLDELGNKSMHYISDATNRMRQLIKGLLDYSRIGRNRELRRLNCNLILDNVIDDLGGIVKESKACIEINQLPEIKGNEMELRLLFQNLITNAIKFRKKQSVPQIKIWAEEEESYLNFHVKDNGIGIAHEHVDKIFIIFQRLKSRREYEGTGIGLAHCRKIVESHGGKIWVESEPDEGSVFHFTMPNQSK
ncbi:MAG: PAS domain S-box protein, partial [Chitinophagales bacterium]|nr:PAS domain S-box protein [Chitinophagales bacterium]